MFGLARDEEVLSSTAKSALPPLFPSRAGKALTLKTLKLAPLDPPPPKKLRLPLSCLPSVGTGSRTLKTLSRLFFFM